MANKLIRRLKEWVKEEGTELVLSFIVREAFEEMDHDDQAEVLEKLQEIHNNTAPA